MKWAIAVIDLILFLKKSVEDFVTLGLKYG